MIAIVMSMRWNRVTLMHFPNGYWGWASFHVFFSHFSVFFGEMSIHVLCPFLNWVAYLFLSLRNSVYILDINPLSEMLLTNIFSSSVGCIFPLLIVSLDAWSFMKSSFSIFFFCCLCLPCHIQEITGKSNIMKILPFVFFSEFYSISSYI